MEDDLHQANRRIQKMKMEHESTLFFVYDVERKCGIKCTDVGWRTKSTKSGYIYVHPNDDHKYFYTNSRGYLDEEKSILSDLTNDYE